VSESRIADVSFTRVIAREKGKLKDKFETTRFEIYNAGQFRTRLDGKHFSKKIPVKKSNRKEFYNTMSRLRIDGKWYNPAGGKYEFFTSLQVAEIVSNKVETNGR